MSNFQVLIQKIFVKPHPNADALELGNIGSPDGWQVVIPKDKYKTGDLVVYIGENAVVPKWVLKANGFWNEKNNKGFLAGSKGDRVKAIKLREQFSLGIVIPTVANGMGDYVFLQNHNPKIDASGYYVLEGQDVSDFLEITKYEPPIPVCMAGEVFNAGTEITLNYDIENIKNYPNIFYSGTEDNEKYGAELVQVTSKLHGTWCGISYVPQDSPLVHPEMLKVSTKIEDKEISGYFAISSKGLGSKGLCFKWNEQNANNLYLKNVRPYLENILQFVYQWNTVVVICGEVFGDGVQDLKYGCKRNETQFRVFDIYKGIRGQGEYLDDWVLDNWCEKMNLTRVPVLYRGPYDWSKIEPLFQGAMETEFDSNQIREGVVIKSQHERKTEIGRACVKAINEAYLLRKGGTELN